MRLDHLLSKELTPQLEAISCFETEVSYPVDAFAGPSSSNARLVDLVSRRVAGKKSTLIPLFRFEGAIAPPAPTGPAVSSSFGTDHASAHDARVYAPLENSIASTSIFWS